MKKNKQCFVSADIQTHAHTNTQESKTGNNRLLAERSGDEYKLNCNEVLDVVKK